MVEAAVRVGDGREQRGALPEVLLQGSGEPGPRGRRQRALDVQQHSFGFVVGDVDGGVVTGFVEHPAAAERDLDGAVVGHERKGPAVGVGGPGQIVLSSTIAGLDQHAGPLDLGLWPHPVEQLVDGGGHAGQLRKARTLQLHLRQQLFSVEQPQADVVVDVDHDVPFGAPARGEVTATAQLDGSDDVATGLPLASEALAQQVDDAHVALAGGDHDGAAHGFDGRANDGRVAAHGVVRVVGDDGDVDFLALRGQQTGRRQREGESEKHGSHRRLDVASRRVFFR